MYMSTDRPDIQYATNELAMCMATPTERAMEGAKHVVRYLLGARDLKLFLLDTSMWEDACSTPSHDGSRW